MQRRTAQGHSVHKRLGPRAWNGACLCAKKAKPIPAARCGQTGACVYLLCISCLESALVATGCHAKLSMEAMEKVMGGAQDTSNCLVMWASALQDAPYNRQVHRLLIMQLGMLVI